MGRRPKSNCLPIKCERGTKCYFVPRALKSPLTTSRPPSLFFLSVAVRASTRVIVCRLFFQICAVWAGFSRGAVWLNATLAPRDRPDGQMWKNVAHQTQTRGKMLFFPLCVKIATYQMPLNHIKKPPVRGLIIPKLLIWKDVWKYICSYQTC